MTHRELASFRFSVVCFAAFLSIAAQGAGISDAAGQDHHAGRGRQRPRCDRARGVRSARPSVGAAGRYRKRARRGRQCSRASSRRRTARRLFTLYAGRIVVHRDAGNVSDASRKYLSRLHARRLCCRAAVCRRCLPVAWREQFGRTGCIVKEAAGRDHLRGEFARHVAKPDRRAPARRARR